MPTDEENAAAENLLPLAEAFATLGSDAFWLVPAALYATICPGQPQLASNPIYLTDRGLLVRNWGTPAAPLLVFCGAVPPDATVKIDTGAVVSVT